ncbi:MAG: hypothetical protein ACREXU_17180 [Gammaproteobacteria bacterium]
MRLEFSQAAEPLKCEIPRVLAVHLRWVLATGRIADRGSGTLGEVPEISNVFG